MAASASYDIAVKGDPKQNKLGDCKPYSKPVWYESGVMFTVDRRACQSNKSGIRLG